jgi:hypothetical protein
VTVPEQDGVSSAVVETVGGSVALHPTTTEEQDRVSLSQRQINLVWETTQMRIALSVIWMSLLVGGTMAVLGRWLGTPDMQLAAVVFLFGVANLVTGFYFGRTNHTRTGGIGGDNAGRR